MCYKSVGERERREEGREVEGGRCVIRGRVRGGRRGEREGGVL